MRATIRVWSLIKSQPQGVVSHRLASKFVCIIGQENACQRLISLCDLFYCAPRLEPSCESALDMGDRFQTHFHRQLSTQCRPPSAGTVEYIGFILIEDVFVIRAVGVNPELQHTAGTGESTGNFAAALDYTDVT